MLLCYNMFDLPFLFILDYIFEGISIIFYSLSLLFGKQETYVHYHIMM